MNLDGLSERIMKAALIGSDGIAAPTVKAVSLTTCILIRADITCPHTPLTPLNHP